eukprot:CAMPEP_0197582352 /NCGR_PEP_ID=MMETSP1326-20131121/5588_1 /TAXON_ID=1155430 /ORGANISM="Genus nov. species nov., Strain RCC2288" /LENGTH=186 /DNA_ID=CAMNT_0043146415 /DNA_START=72 /DNA_END=629 /DNA_ORIENTATION=-
MPRAVMTSMRRRPPADIEDQDDNHPAAQKHKFISNVMVFFGFVFIAVPIIVLALSFLFGLMLAEAEGWPIKEGFYYVTSMLCGLPNPLTDFSPETDRGKIVDIVIAIWSLALAGTIIGVVGGMTVISELIASAEGLGKKFTKFRRQLTGFKADPVVRVSEGTHTEAHLHGDGDGDAAAVAAAAAAA